MRVAFVCIFQFLIQLALGQNTNNCAIRLGSSNCDYHRLLYFTNVSEILLKDNYRILVYRHHFIELKVKHKVCLLKRIFQFYDLVLENISTTKVAEQTFSALKDLLRWLSGHCMKCRDCQKLIQNKIQVAGKYSKSGNMNETLIIQYQLKLLKIARRKKKKHPAEIQEKVIYELPILSSFLDTIEYETTHAPDK